MKWLSWISKVFGGTTKSMQPLGIGLRSALGGCSPGGWASDHREETAHNTGFNYVAIHAIAAQVAGATVSVFADGEQQPRFRARRKMLAAGSGSFSRWKSTYGADDRETDPLPISHPLVRLLKRPNPHESGASFRYRQAQQVRLTGTCLVWNVPSMAGQPCERYVIPTAMATPVCPTAQLPRGGWRINPSTSRYTPIVDDGYVDCPSWYRILGQIVDARQIQVIRLPHAWYLDDGQSPLSAGSRWVDAGDAVDVARYHQLRNGVDPSIVWNLPPDVSPDQDEIDRVHAKISARYGGPENVGRVMVAQSGTSITPLSTSPKEMCYTEGFHDFKAAILALHQTPPVAVGLQEPGAYAAYNASMKAWRHAAVQPLCDLLAESDTEILAPQFGNGLTVEIESDTVDDAELVEAQLRNDLAAKVRTKNEWRAVRGMPPLSGPRGNDLVGVDDHKSDDSQDSSSDNPDRPREKGLTQTKSDLSDKYSEQDEDPQSANLNESALPKGTDEELWRKAELIAGILNRLYGDRAQSLVDDLDLATDKAFDPALHPRGSHGRFVRRGTAEEIAESHSFISQVLAGQTYTNDTEKVVNALPKMTNSELEDLHQTYGIAPLPRGRGKLVRSVFARLDRPVQVPSQLSGERDSLSRTGSIRVHVRNGDELSRIMGRRFSEQEWGQLVGAQPGAEIHVYKQTNTFSSVNVVVYHPDYKAVRTIRLGHIENVEFEVRPEMQRQGLGARILWEQAQAAKEKKFDRIITASKGQGTKLRRPGEKVYEGYYAWPRLGFDGNIEDLMSQRRASQDPRERATVRDFEKKFPGIDRVLDLMKTPEGRKWWKEYGGDLELIFDLGPKSRSMRVLENYIKDKQIESKPKSWRIDSAIQIRQKSKSVPAGHCFWSHEDLEKLLSDPDYVPVESPDPLSEDDELLLDHIWDEIDQDDHSCQQDDH